MGTKTPFADVAAAIDADRTQWWQDLRAFNKAAGKTGAMADEIMRRSDALDARVEAARRAYFPRAHRLIIGNGDALLVSKTARSVRRVWSAN